MPKGGNPSLSGSTKMSHAVPGTSMKFSGTDKGGQGPRVDPQGGTRVNPCKVAAFGSNANVVGTRCGSRSGTKY